MDSAAQERLVKRDTPPAPAEEDTPVLSEDAAAAEVASSQVVAAVEAAGVSGEPQSASGALQDDKSMTVRSCTPISHQVLVGPAQPDLLTVAAFQSQLAGSHGLIPVGCPAC